MNLPFTNIRQVLSLHNKVSPEKIFLTVVTDKGREELSYAEFSARCHQTANFLQEDLNIEPGVVVAIGNLSSLTDDDPGDTAVLFIACWLIGAVAAYFGIGRTFVDHAKVYFIRYGDHIDFNYVMQNPIWNGKQIIQLGGEPSDYPYFHTLVRGMPNTFFNEYPEPTRDTPALRSILNDESSIEVFSQGDLLDAAQNLANSQVITGNQRLISYLMLADNGYNHEITLNRISLLMAALLVGGSLIVDTRFNRWGRDTRAYPKVFWREIAASRLHIACVSGQVILMLIAYGYEQKALSQPIYGEGVYQQDIKQLRHIYCPDVKPDDDRIREFTAMFPFPVVTNNE